jgi:hypothetical protein
MAGAAIVVRMVGRNAIEKFPNRKPELPEEANTARLIMLRLLEGTRG